MQQPSDKNAPRHCTLIFERTSYRYSTLAKAVPSATSSGVIASTQAPSTMSSAKFKVILLGDQSVGKTSLLTRFIFNSYDAQYQATIGIDFFSKLVYLEGTNRCDSGIERHTTSNTIDSNHIHCDKDNDMNHTRAAVRLHLWDTAGQERYHALIASYIRHSAAAVIVYDISSRTTFAHAQRYVNLVRAECGQDVVIALVGNKSDLPASLREVSRAEAEEKAASCGESVWWTETSARTGWQVRSLFGSVAQRVWNACCASHAFSRSAPPHALLLGRSTYTELSSSSHVYCPDGRPDESDCSPSRRGDGLEVSCAMSSSALIRPSCASASLGGTVSLTAEKLTHSAQDSKHSSHCCGV